MKKYTKITKELIDKVILLNKNGHSYSEIGKILELSSVRGIQNFIRKNKIKFVNNSSLITIRDKKYKSQDDYFDIIDNHKKAYILGFIYSDGCVYDNKRFGFCISEQDSEILDFIRQEVCPNKPYKVINHLNKKPQVVLRIGNKRIVKTLIEKWGVVPNKTKNPKLVFPKIEDSFIWSFLRGIVDGDGHIRIRTTKSFYVEICMSDLNFLSDLQKFLDKNNMKSKIKTIVGKTCNYYRIYIPNSITFLNKLYENKDFFCLKRKLHKYLIIHDNIELTSSITKGEEVV